MKIIALEEHFVVPELMDAWHDGPDATEEDSALERARRVQRALLDTGEQRIADMDDQGVDVQVLSLTSPGVQNLPAPDAVSLARQANDALADVVAGHPDRFQGFAAIPTPDPAAAAAELERAVATLGFPGALINGRTGDLSMDSRVFDDLYGVAERLGAPLYLHPQAPTAPVRDAYYSGFGDLDFILSSPAIGWHYETGMQFLRMAIGGVFDRHPGMQVVLGHWGELVLFYLDRAQPVLEQAGLHLQRPLSEVVRENVWVTGSGILSERYYRWACEVVGADRIMTATDYPYIDNSGGAARTFVEGLPATEADRTAAASGNWERLTGRRAGQSSPNA
ncbi:amidohydrolase family protein [Streptomyces sp. 900105755]